MHCVEKTHESDCTEDAGSRIRYITLDVYKSLPVAARLELHQEVFVIKDMRNVCKASLSAQDFVDCINDEERCIEINSVILEEELQRPPLLGVQVSGQLTPPSGFWVIADLILVDYRYYL
jgi:hypothetical protein